MRKALFLLLGLAVLLGSGMGLSAQEVTITLLPGWTWIGFPYVEEKSVIDAFPGFVPLSGDQIKSKAQTSMYDEDEEEWSGNLQTLIPGKGYMYYSTRPEAVSVVLGSPAPQVSVTTSEPTNITYYSAVCGGTVTASDGDHIFMRGVCWSTEPNPTIDDSHTTDETGIGDWEVMVWGLAMNTAYHVRAYVVSDHGLKYGDNRSFTTESVGVGGDHDYVDLGLPSGLLWATCNVGAENPEDYGDYFAWGETQPKENYDWTTYQYCKGSSNTLTKYCNNSSYGYNGFTDNLTTLLPEDDAATANWGNGWRTPTQAEFQELLDNTTVTWTTQNGVNGRLFTAPNGNSLFLPAAGCRVNSDLINASSYGEYWSSSLDTECPAWVWYFYYSSDDYGVDNISRRYARSVRPVCSGQN